MTTAFAWAALPTRADRRLRSACRKAKEPEAALRAVEAWRREAGIVAAECAPVRKIEAAVFGGDAGDNGRPPRDAASALLSLSRQTRRAALIRWLGAMADTILGRAVHIATGPRATPFTNALRLKSDSR